MHILQKIVLPSLDIKADINTYVHVTGPSSFSLGKSCVDLSQNGRILLDTFYNSFDISLWKNRCGIHELFVALKGTGRVRVQCFFAKVGLSHKIIDEWECHLEESVIHRIMGFDAISETSGKLYLVVSALSNVNFIGGEFLTSQKPVNNVKLGIIITHFNRKQYVLPAIKRIERFISSNPIYNNNIELVVVDNSRNINHDEVDFATLIPNKNLGGSGGFTRGLIHSMSKNFSHCLFMDDDGSCEIESIRRVYTLLSYNRSNSEKFSISGILIPENSTSRVEEKGGNIDLQRVCFVPNKAGLNIANFENVLRADDNFDQISYGAWCFFAFPLKGVEKMPFPFFVRGDDVLFSLQNKFEIISPSGIAVYIDEFQPKESPLVKYLTARAMFFIAFVYAKNNRINKIRLFSQWYLSSLFSYQYDSAKTIYLALKDIANGGRIFLDDEDGAIRRSSVKKLVKYEILNDRLPKDVLVSSTLSESKLKTVFRYLTLNGLLLPKFLFKSGLILQERGWRGTFRQIFRYREVYYYTAIDGKGYIVSHKKKEIIKGLMYWLQGCAIILLKHHTIEKKLDKLCDLATSIDFWHKKIK